MASSALRLFARAPSTSSLLRCAARLPTLHIKPLPSLPITRLPSASLCQPRFPLAASTLACRPFSTNPDERFRQALRRGVAPTATRVRPRTSPKRSDETGVVPEER
jgi:hypothetical protein